MFGLPALKVEFPPISGLGRRVWMLRGYRDETVTVFLENHFSYELTADNLLAWLKMLGWSDEAAQSLGAYVWNFYGVVVDLRARTFDWRSQEDVLNAVAG